MRSDRLRILLVSGVLLTVTGCATSEEWATWRAHRTHFASGEHLEFSVRNTAGSQPQVKRRDIALAKDQAWWGKPITVSQEQILEK